jgi:hypothetical protein
MPAGYAHIYKLEGRGEREGERWMNAGESDTVTESGERGVDGT